MKSYVKDDYSLKKFLPDDWKNYKAIRLEALQTNPEVFGSNYAKESAYIDDEWQSILKNEARAYFGLYHKDDLIGVTGVALDHEDPNKHILLLLLFAMFIVVNAFQTCFIRQE